MEKLFTREDLEKAYDAGSEATKDIYGHHPVEIDHPLFDEWFDKYAKNIISNNEAVAFAEWVAEKRFLMKKDKLWYKKIEQFEDEIIQTTDELYEEFKRMAVTPNEVQK